MMSANPQRPAPREPEAICNRCNAPKGLQAIGESCNNNCGGRVVANPRRSNVPESTGQTINMQPHPSLVRAALAHCEIPLEYTDAHAVEVPDDLTPLLSAVVTTAMVKHVEDTMILPSNVSRIREQASFLSDIAFSMERFPGGDENEERTTIEGIVETLNRVADNLDPAKR